MPRGLRILLCLATAVVVARGTLVPCRAAGATGSDIAVVVNSEVKEDNLPLAALRKVVLGDRQFWSGSQRVTLIIRAPEARERAVVLKKLYQMDDAQFRQYWIAKVFRAEIASGPKTVTSNEVATELVSSLSGAIAFVDSAQVPRSAKLKVLKVDSLMPGEKGYPLR